MRLGQVWFCALGRGKDLFHSGDSFNFDLDRFDDRPESPVGVTPSEDCLPSTLSSPGVSPSPAHEALDVDSVCVDVFMISDFIEPRYSADGNVGLEDYVDVSFGTDIGGYSVFVVFLCLNRSRWTIVHCLRRM